jgi:cation:H+ antiporter
VAWLEWLINWPPVWMKLSIGLVLLLAGAEALVRGASRLAAGMGVPPLVVGLTVVAFGTSAPELAVSVGGSLTGQSDVAVGNIVGSNVMNILVVLGASAIIAPLAVKSQLVKLDVPLMIVASLAVWLMAANGYVSRIEGAALVAALVAYLVMVYVNVRRGKAAATVDTDLDIETDALTPGEIVSNVALVLVGMAGLALGARWLVDGAVTIAQAAGVSELVIGLTVVAFGTSLPEIATSLLAAWRGQRDLAVGNVVGSNLFNLLCVLGLTAALPPAGVPVSSAAIQFDLPVMCAVAVVCLPIFLTGGRVSRWEGGLLLVYFVAYMAYLLLDANEHALAEPVSWVVLAFVVPLTGIGLIASVIVWTERRRKRGKQLSRLRRQREAETPTPAG